MSESRPVTKPQAWFGLVAGFLILSLAAIAVGKWITTGTLQFTIKNITATGPVALFETSLCAGVGLCPIAYSLRQLRRFYVF